MLLAPMCPTRNQPTSQATFPWAKLSDRKLLQWRMCDLGLKLRGSPLEERIRSLRGELKQRGLKFRPYFWLSDEWFTPDGIPGCAIPFYLVHPRLMELERSQMLEVEGEKYEQFMRILRHETGHAIDNAYGLRRRRRRQKIFGRAGEPYPDFYAPKPYSRNYVLHLDSWYAQSHPTEDFAETFAVWLTPGSSWRTRYTRWPALKKLEYVDALMREIADQKPLVRTRQKVEVINTLKKTLKEHYDSKRERYEIELPKFYDRDLKRLFSAAPEHRAHPRAPDFLATVQKEVRHSVGRWTGAFQYTIDQILKDMIARSRELDLHLRASEDQTTRDFMIVLAVHTMNYLHTGRYRLAL